tara:strand:+ start:1578 stop:2096 length:519 start_codon:yes stop_codon:yes gene_type:complete
MLTKGYTYNVLNEFKKYVIQQARTNLTRGKKNVNSKLYKSLDGDVEVGKTSFSLSFVMEDYGVFQDKGVSGTKKKYNTPFSYTSKRPPAKSLEKWIGKRGFQFRDAKGRFLSYKSMSYIISKSIFEKGIKPSLFFTKPFEKAFERLPNELVEAYGLDVEDFLAFTFNNKRLR